jgi:hypothetical protein
MFNQNIIGALKKLSKWISDLEKDTIRPSARLLENFLDFVNFYMGVINNKLILM